MRQNTANINQLTNNVMILVPIYLWLISNPVHETLIKYTIDQANQNTYYTGRFPTALQLQAKLSGFVLQIVQTRCDFLTQSFLYFYLHT